jgi:hypothetical protein
LRGNPLLTYTVDIDGLGYSRSSVTGLASLGTGTASLSLSADTLEGERLAEDRYDGQLRLVFRGDGEERVLYDRTVTVGVER